MKTKNSYPKIFRASEQPPSKFPYDDRPSDDWSGDELCPFCNRPLGEHTIREGVRCAFNVLKEGK